MHTGWVYLLFFCSGFPALLYQIVWQRALFTIYGVNVESVTMVVTAFMAGLGLGSLLGGYISKIRRAPLLGIFGAVEFGIGLYGIFSLRLFHYAAEFTAGAGPWGTGLASFLLVLLPTVLMGGTLPLLVAHLVANYPNVGRAVGVLYAVNTFGSAAACMVAATLTMRYLGQSGSVILAATLNAIIGTCVIAVLLDSRRDAPVLEIQNEASTSGAGLLPFPLAMLVAAVSGFIALAYEIVWYRIYSFATGGLAKSFAFVLGFYLTGIALGSLAIRGACEKPDGGGALLRILARLVLVANLLAFLVAPLVAVWVPKVPLWATFPLITLATVLLGATFPLVAHVSIKPDLRAGAGLSYLYLSNIVGSAAGSFLVGFVLMNRWGLRVISLLLLLMGTALAVALAAPELKSRPRQMAGALAAVAVVLVLAVVWAGRTSGNLYERLLYKEKISDQSRFAQLVENRSGVIAVTPDGSVYGGGIYDGRFNIDLVHDTNGIFRAYALSSFHPAPRKVLMVGLSSGSWAQVLVNHPQVEKLTIVEINAGYLRLIPLHPEVASLLGNAKVEIAIDDGRRWLRAHPERKFDAIVMNTTFYYRDHATNLLSREFLQLIRAHLAPGGIHYYNTTFSVDAQLTGLTVFPYGLRVGNFLAVSDSPVRVDQDRWRRILLAYTIDGKPVLDSSRSDDARALAALISIADTALAATPAKDWHSMEYGHLLRARNHARRLFTDDNMGSEWDVPMP